MQFRRLGSKTCDSIGVSSLPRLEGHCQRPQDHAQVRSILINLWKGFQIELVENENAKEIIKEISESEIMMRVNSRIDEKKEIESKRKTWNKIRKQEKVQEI